MIRKCTKIALKAQKASSKCNIVTEVMLYVENVPINAPLKLVIKKRNLLFVLYIDCIES